MCARRHDDLVGALSGQRALRRDLEQFVAGQVGQIVQRLHPGLAERDQHRRLQPLDRGQLVVDAEFDPTTRVDLVPRLEEVAGAVAQFLGDLLVETFDLGQFFDRDEGDVLDGGEPFGDQQVGDHVIDVQRVDEGLRARAELLVASHRLLVFGENVDVPPASAARPAGRSGRAGRSPG